MNVFLTIIDYSKMDLKRRLVYYIYTKDITTIFLGCCYTNYNWKEDMQASEMSRSGIKLYNNVL